MSTTKGLRRREFVDLLQNEGLRYITFKEQGLGFTVQCEDEEEVTTALEMDGMQVGRQILRVTKSNKTMGVTQTFDLLGDHLQTREDAHTRCPTIKYGRKKNSRTGKEG